MQKKFILYDLSGISSKNQTEKEPENHGHFSLANTILTKFGNWFGGFFEGTGDRFDAVTDSTFCHSSIVNN